MVYVEGKFKKDQVKGNVLLITNRMFIFGKNLDLIIDKLNTIENLNTFDEVIKFTHSNGLIIANLPNGM